MQMSTKALCITLGAALSCALYYANDNFIMKKKIVSKESLWARFFYLMIGAWIGLACTLTFSVIFGWYLDPGYQGLIILSKKVQLYAVGAGSLDAIATLLYLWSNQRLDPTVVMAFTSTSIVYLTIFDLVIGKATLLGSIPSLVLVIAGSILASVEKKYNRTRINTWSIVILLVFRAILDAIATILRQLGGQGIDAVNFNLWRFFWLTTTATILVMLFSSLKKGIRELIAVRLLFKKALPWIFLTMTFAFMSNVLFQRALGIATVSLVYLVFNTRIVMGIPISLIGAQMKSNPFGGSPQGKKVWLLRIIGIILLVTGITILKIRGIG